MNKIIDSLTRAVEGFSKLSPSNKLIVGSLALSVVLLFAVNALYKDAEIKAKTSEKRMREALERCLESKKELELDYIEYLKKEKEKFEKE